ncbi:Pr6Pr family membrane protein [Jatrophihabitans sp. YIM 134969]
MSVPGSARSSSSARAVIAARCCYGLIAAVITTASTIQLVLLFTGGADANSGDSNASLSVGTRLVHLFSYFTIDSNIIVLAVSIGLLVDPARDGRLWRVAHLDALLSIVITGLVFAIVLAPHVHLTGAALAATIGFHYISPWATLVTWLVFGPRPAFTWSTAAWAFVWPALWIAYTFAHGAATEFYPYPFLDAATKGYPRALAGTAVVLIVAIALAVTLKLGSRLPAQLHPRATIRAEDRGQRS